jgi:hypothetical protein
VALILAGCGVTTPPQPFTPPAPSPSASEAPTGFDDKSNGTVDDSTHQADRTAFDGVEDIADGLRVEGLCRSESLVSRFRPGRWHVGPSGIGACSAQRLSLKRSQASHYRYLDVSRDAITTNGVAPSGGFGDLWRERGAAKKAGAMMILTLTAYMTCLRLQSVLRLGTHFDHASRIEEHQSGLALKGQNR